MDSFTVLTVEIVNFSLISLNSMRNNCTALTLFARFLFVFRLYPQTINISDVIILQISLRFLAATRIPVPRVGTESTHEGSKTAAEVGCAHQQKTCR